MNEALFLNLDSVAMALEISAAERSVCYAAPGILQAPAKAMADLAKRIGPELITVSLDFDERVMRMGFGTLDAVKTLRNAGIEVRSTPGLRTGLMISDDTGYIFTPTALYLEAERSSEEAPNAMRLSAEQVKEALARLSPAAKLIAIAFARTEEEKAEIRAKIEEVQSDAVDDDNFKLVEKRLQEAPPAKFDVARQVRVYNAYLQYVELKLSGAAIQRRRFSIPPSIQKLGGAEDLEGRLKTTFDLIERSGELSSKALDDRLNEIKRDFIPSLGKVHGRVLLNAAKPHFEKRLEDLRIALKIHQAHVEQELQDQLNASRKQIVDYYMPRVVENPPDAMRGQFLRFTENDARAWLNGELDRVFPTAEKLIRKMQLDVQYKDVTFETLNGVEFLDAVKKAFPKIDWNRAHDEFQAVGEKGG